MPQLPRREQKNLYHLLVEHIDHTQLARVLKHNELPELDEITGSGNHRDRTQEVVNELSKRFKIIELVEGAIVELDRSCPPLQMWLEVHRVELLRRREDPNLADRLPELSQRFVLFTVSGVAILILVLFIFLLGSGSTQQLRVANGSSQEGIKEITTNHPDVVDAGSSIQPSVVNVSTQERSKEMTTNGLEVVDVRFVEATGPSKPNDEHFNPGAELELLVTNRGDTSVVLSNVFLEIEAMWELTPTSWAAGSGLDVSAKYHAEIPVNASPPFSVTVPIAHILEPGKADRFQIYIAQTPSWTEVDHVVRAFLRVEFDKSGQFIETSPIMFTLGSGSWQTMSFGDMPNMSDKVSSNRSAVNQIGDISMVKSTRRLRYILGIIGTEPQL